MWKRGQSAVEYLTIVALSLLILVPTSFYVLNYASNLQSETQSRQLGVVGDQIISTVDEVYASERGSFIRLTVELPDSTRSTSIRDNREIVIETQTELGRSDLVFFSENVNVTNGTISCTPRCSLPLSAGQNKVKVENAGDQVTIS